MLAKLAPWQTTLLEAAEMIKNRGWMTSRVRGSEVGECAYTAISTAAENEGEVVDAAMKRLCGVIGRGTDRPLFEVIRWNDAPERTAAEVIKALQEAAL